MTEIDFVDGDEASDKATQNDQKHLSEIAQGLLLRTIKNTRVGRRNHGQLADRQQQLAGERSRDDSLH